MDWISKGQPDGSGRFDWNAYDPNVQTPGHGHAWGTQNGVNGWRPQHDFQGSSVEQNLGWLANKGSGVHFG